MDAAIIAALITAGVAAFAGIFNIFLTIHKNRQEGITLYRMNWIENVRNEFSTIFGWSPFTQSPSEKLAIRSIDDMRIAVAKVNLFLNISDEYDKELLVLCNQYLDQIEESYNKMQAANSTIDQMQMAYRTQLSKNDWHASKRTKRKLMKMVRVYLKTEWTRVKVDSAINKWPYRKFWSILKGFDAEKAIQYYSDHYLELKK